MSLTTHQLEEQLKQMFRFNWRRFPEWMRLRLNDTQRYVIIWILSGLLCGFAAVLFHQAIDLVFKMVSAWAHVASSVSPIGLYGVLIIAPAIGGVLAGLIVRYIEPTAVGSGIPQTKERYYRHFGYFRLREAFWRFLAGALSVGSGNSLGREGPTVHICATIASVIGQVFGVAKKRVQAMVPIGMGAGIAAAFNTPMAAMFFVFEELMGDFSTKSMFGILLAVVIAAIVERTILGEHPAFALMLPQFHTDWWMLVALPLGIIAALFGVGFVSSILRFRQKMRDASRLPSWIRPGVGGLGVGMIGALVLWSTQHYGVFGIGYADLSMALNGRMLTLTVVLALFCGKFLATILAYGCGGSGGLFAPALFIGGFLGAIVGIIGQQVFSFGNDVVGAISLLGMGAFFAAVIRCPLTSFMIIFELTRNYTLILPLMVGNSLAYMLALRWQPVAIYDALLLQDKISLKKSPSYQGAQDWQNLPIQTIMTFDPVTIRCEQSIDEGLASVRYRKHHAYPVMNDAAQLCGMITHHELELLNQEDGTRLLQSILKKRAVVSVNPNQSIRDVAAVLVMKDVLQVPVVSATESTKLLGIVTLHDVARQQNAISEGIER
jgi:CIC family chloride channel protein